MIRFMSDPCSELLTEGQKAICRGERGKRLQREYVEHCLSNGTLTADPRVRQRESRQPREKRERTESTRGSNGRVANPCKHLGDVLRLDTCKVCGGTRQYEVRACSIHGECTIRELKATQKKCINCLEYEKP